MRINAEDVKYFGREIIAERTLKEMSRALAEEIVKFIDLETVYLPEYNAESVRGRVRIVKLDTKYY